MNKKGRLSTPFTLRSLVALAAAIAGMPAFALAGTWYTTNDGADSATCGHSRDKACRSISQAIENASDGDIIWVGAGRYGDLNGNGSFADPGDEHALVGNGNGASCVVCVTKAIRIYSYNGTAATVIEGHSAFQAAVQILSDRVVFGSKDHGFTIAGGQVGIEINYDTIGAPATGAANGTALQVGITVAGNLLTGVPTGIDVEGQPDKPSPNCPENAPCVPRGRVLLLENTVMGGDTGFLVNDNFNHTSAIVLQDNLALGSTIGFGTYSNFTGVGGNVVLGSSAESVHLSHNVAARGAVGFAAAFVGSLENNVAAGNSQAGFVIVPGGFPATIFTGNAATGNAGPGAIISFDDPANMQLGFRTFSQNDFYGNDRNRPASLTIGYPADPVGAYSPGPSANCGILNIGALAAVPPLSAPLPVIHLDASNNYWGSANGPGSPNADAVGGACDQNGAVTNGKPFLNTWVSFVPLPQ